MIDMPQIPFEVYDKDYNKTIHVMAGCKLDIGSLVLYFSPIDEKIATKVMTEVNKAFDKPGLTKILVCREEKVK